MLRTFARQFRLLLSKDETCYVAHHPDCEHPYELTRPLPKITSEKQEESILRINSKNMITKSPNLEQLQNLTYTPASYWKQYQGKAKRRKHIEYFNDNVDRSGLTS